MLVVDRPGLVDLTVLGQYPRVERVERRGETLEVPYVAIGRDVEMRNPPATKPLVVRLDGNNMVEGRRILAANSFPIIAADSLADAADKVVAAWQRSQSARTPLRAAS